MIKSQPAHDSSAAASQSRSAAIEIDRASKTYPNKNGDVQVLDEISLSIDRGKFVSLVGKSGCGKSTLLSMIGGLTGISDGSIIVDGCQVEEPQTQMGFVFQSPTLLKWRTALDNVLLQAEAKNLPKEGARPRAEELLSSVGLANAINRRPQHLSGGMQQRVGICRALLHDPSTLLMDEPFSALDEITRDEMTQQLQTLWMEDVRTVVFVTHSIAEATLLSDRVIVLGGQPSAIALDIEIDLPRPRTIEMREEPEFGRYVRQIRGAL